MSFDLSSVIKTVAPFLANALVPGSGFVISAASSLISAIGGDAAAPIQQAVASGNEQSIISTIGDMFQKGAINAAQLKQAEQAHAEKMAELGYKNVADLETIAAGDRKSARDMQTAVRSRMPAALSIIAVLGFVAIAVIVLMGLATPAFKEPATAAIAGALVMLIISEVKQTYSFWMGTTANSGRKDDTIADIAKAP